MRDPFVAAVMVHVPNVADGLAWYQRAFPSAIRARILEPEFEYLLVAATRIEVVQADSKVASGPCGSVVYWRVPQFEEALSHMQGIGANLYRGPMQIEGGDLMCQVQDPWGNCIGLRGPSGQLPEPSVR
jgi:predicted enzyme related to lactoylglutathione lyase